MHYKNVTLHDILILTIYVMFQSFPTSLLYVKKSVSLFIIMNISKFMFIYKIKSFLCCVYFPLHFFYDLLIQILNIKKIVLKMDAVSQMCNKMKSSLCGIHFPLFVYKSYVFIRMTCFVTN